MYSFAIEPMNGDDDIAPYIVDTNGDITLLLFNLIDELKYEELFSGPSNAVGLSSIFLTSSITFNAFLTD